MQWLDLVARDPVPWLLDPGNPSARFQTLKHIFRKPREVLDTEQQHILTWQPVEMLRRHWGNHNFWGRAGNPYYGGPLGNFGTLYLLTQLGAPTSHEVEPTCEDLLSKGRRPDGLFAPEGVSSAPWLCYTGIALQILEHFGYGDDPRVLTAWATVLKTLQQAPEDLNCDIDNRDCRAGAVKLLRACIHREQGLGVPTDEEIIERLCTHLLHHRYDWRRDDADWLRMRFPRFYDADLVECLHVLAHTRYRDHPTAQDMAKQMLTLQDASGRWSKLKATPITVEERLHQPSRWLTFEAIHTLMLLYGDTMYAPRRPA